MFYLFAANIAGDIKNFVQISILFIKPELSKSEWYTYIRKFLKLEIAFHILELSRLYIYIAIILLKTFTYRIRITNKLPKLFQRSKTTFNSSGCSHVSWNTIFAILYFINLNLKCYNGRRGHQAWCISIHSSNPVNCLEQFEQNFIRRSRGKWALGAILS